MAGDNGAEALAQQSVTYDPNATVERGGRVLLLRLACAGEEIPTWEHNSARDDYLRKLLRKPEYGLLAGAVAIQTMKAVGWQYELAEGAPAMREFCGASLDERAELGEGGAVWLSRMAWDFFSQDKGATSEVLDLTLPDEAGGKRAPLRPPPVGVVHLDAAQCELTRDPDWPVIYWNPGTGKRHILHRTRVLRVVDQPSPDWQFRGLGLCAVSRVLQRAGIVARQSTLQSEYMSDLPPSGMAITNNFKLDDVKKQADLEQKQAGHTVFRDIYWVENLDPEHPATLEFIRFATLPDGYDPMQEFQLAMLIFAMAWGVDVRDFTSLSQGELGTAAEAEIKHFKARGMGTAYFRRVLADALNRVALAGTGVTFRWVEQDEEQEMLRAEIQHAQAETVEMAIRSGAMRTDEGRQRLFEAGLLTEEELQQGGDVEETEDKSEDEDEAPPPDEELPPQEPEIEPVEGERQVSPSAITPEALGPPAPAPEDDDAPPAQEAIDREAKRWATLPALAPYAPGPAPARQAPIPDDAREALAEVRVAAFRNRAADLCRALAAGEVSLSEWEMTARREIRDLHIGMVVIGRGGWEAVTPHDWARVGSEVRQQARYLHEFALQIEAHALAGTPYSEAALRARLQLYGEAAWTSFWRGHIAALGINPDDLPAIPGDGSTVCLVNCRCRWSFEFIEGGLAEAYWVLNPSVFVEHCQDCLDRALEWNPWPGGPVRVEG